MAENLASDVTIGEEAPKQRSVPVLPTSVCLFVGVTERGPVGEATQVSSFGEYVDVFGGYTPNGWVAIAVAAFFANGGTNAWIARVVHYTDPLIASTKTSTAATLSLVDRAAVTPIATLKIDGKTDGTYAHSLKPLIEAPTSGNANEFNYSTVNLSGVRLETFPNLKIGAANASDPRYVETVINDPETGSKYVAVTDLENATASPNNLPALGLGAVLATGNDGLTGIVDSDYIGSPGAKNGIYAGDYVEDMTLLVVPGIATSAVQNAMLTYCTVARGGQPYALLDPPASQSATQIIIYVKTTAALQGLTECGHIHWPRWKISNPNPTVFGPAKKITVPISGHIAGMFARTDGARSGGVYDQPAGTETGALLGLLEPETKEVLDLGKRALVFPERINPVTKISGTGVFLDGARNLKGNGNWPSTGQRRGVSHIQQSIKRSMQVFRHKNRTDDLLAEEKRTVDQFMEIQCGLGAFITKNPKQAFYSDFGKALNPAATPNTTKARIGVATAEPNEFINLLFSEDKTAYANAQ
jgi:phage tail sheath protein FI